MLKKITAVIATMAFAFSNTSAAADFEQLEGKVVELMVVGEGSLFKMDFGLFKEKQMYSTGVIFDDEIVVTTKHSLYFNETLGKDFYVSGKNTNGERQCRVKSESKELDLAFLFCPGVKYPGKKQKLSDAKVGQSPLYAVGFPSYKYTQRRMLLSRGELIDERIDLPGSEALPKHRDLSSLDAPVYAGQSGGGIFDKQMGFKGLIIKADQLGDGTWNGKTYFIRAEKIAQEYRRLKPAKGTK